MFRFANTLVLLIGFTSIGFAQTQNANQSALLADVELGWDESRVRARLGPNYVVITRKSQMPNGIPALYFWGYGAADEESFPVNGLVGFNKARKASVILRGPMPPKLKEVVEDSKIQAFYNHVYKMPIVVSGSYDPRDAVRAANLIRPFGKDTAAAVLVYFDSVWPYNPMGIAAIAASLFDPQPQGGNGIGPNQKMPIRQAGEYPFSTYRGWPILKNDGQSKVQVPTLIDHLLHSATFVTENPGQPPSIPGDFVDGIQATPAWSDVKMPERHKDYQRLTVMSQAYKIYSLPTMSFSILPSHSSSEKAFGFEEWSKFTKEFAMANAEWDDESVRMIEAGSK